MPTAFNSAGEVQKEGEAKGANIVSLVLPSLGED